jgi:hypothetical protein
MKASVTPKLFKPIFYARAIYVRRARLEGNLLAFSVL